MMTATTKCSIPFCGSPNGHFISFEAEKKIRQQWLQSLSQENLKYGVASPAHPLFLNMKHLDNVCPLHFNLDSADLNYVMERDGGICIRLHDYAIVPTILPWSPEWIQLAAVQVVIL